jgi:hypothetical protein
LLRNGIPYGEFSELVKKAYVAAALEDFPDGKRRPSDSRAAVMTGLTRKEIKRQRDMLAGESTGKSGTLHANRASRVVSGWVHDKAYQSVKGDPANLPFDGELSFSGLVKQYSGDIPPRAVLGELLRVGVVSVDSDSGWVTLQQRAYVPAGDSEEMLEIFGEDVSDLVATMDYNLVSNDKGQRPLFQRTLTYNNIPSDIIERWREHSARQSQALLEQLDNWLAPHDRDISGDTDGQNSPEAVRTGVSIFYFEDPLQSQLQSRIQPEGEL